MTTVRRGGRDDEIYNKLSLETDDELQLQTTGHSSSSFDVEDDFKDIEDDKKDSSSTSISQTGYKVLLLLALQNSFKNLLMRYVMIEKPQFLLSTAVITVELLKLLFSVTYIVFYQKGSLTSIYRFVFKDDRQNTILVSVPASCYIMQMTLEYVAFANIDAASFSVLVQLKVLFTALFFKIVLAKRLMKKQMLSLLILTVGVMLCNMVQNEDGKEEVSGAKLKGIAATLGKLFHRIMFCNSFALFYCIILTIIVKRFSFFERYCCQFRFCFSLYRKGNQIGS